MKPLLDRFWISVIAYHNVILGRRLESEIDASVITLPNYTVLLLADQESIQQRMMHRSPRHRYETDTGFLLDVQREFLRVIDAKTLVIDTSKQTIDNVVNKVMEDLVRRNIVGV